MKRHAVSVVLILLLAPSLSQGADWTQFRGPGGLGVSDEKSIPVKWSSAKNIVWQTELPGPGASSPITLGNRIFLTCYSGYGLKANASDQAKLVRHLLCFDRSNGEVIWSKKFQPKLPEHKYQGEGAYHGYAASTPTTDGKRLYVSFGKSGVFCFDLDGRQLWQASVGERINRWGSGCSPVLYENLLIVNASVESGSLVALDKLTGKEVWRVGGIRSSWNTPLLFKRQNQQTELVVSISGRLLGFDADTGKDLWSADGVHRYVCPSVVAHKNVVFAIGGGHTSLAVRLGGRGDVTKTHGIWRKTKGSNVSSPIYHDGHLYWASAGGGFVCCQDAATGETVFQQRIEPRPGRIWTSPILADGKLYFVSQHNGTYVVAAKPKYELLSHNVLEDDNSRTNASPAASNGQLLLRTDRTLYCIGQK